MLTMMNPHNGGNSSSSDNSNASTASQACAACKFQRRKCPADCPLAPYFPAEANHRFLSCKRLFGVSNMLRFLRDAEPGERDDTMKSLVYEAEVRDRDPVHGCLGIISALSDEVKSLQRELDLTRSLVHHHQQQQQQQVRLLQHQHQHQQQQQQQQPEVLAQPLSSCLGSIGSSSSSHPLALPLYRHSTGSTGPHLSLEDPFDFEHLDHKYLIKP